MKCNVLPILVYSVMFFVSGASSTAKAAGTPITKPAGELPVGSALDSNHLNITSSPDEIDDSIPKNIGSARSRVIPKSRMATTQPSRHDVQADVGPRVIARKPEKNIPVRRVAASEKKGLPEPVVERVNSKNLDGNPDGHAAKNVVEVPASEVPPLPSSEGRPTSAANAKAAGKKQKNGELNDPIPQDLETKVLRVEDVIERSEPFQFAGKDKPDPFIPPIGSIESKQELKSLSADEIPIVSPLQYFSVKQLVVTGVWQGADNRWKAMIETPDQQGVIVQAGDPIGDSGGHVANIGPNGVKVRQYKLQRDGARLYGETVIGMAPETAEKSEVGGKIILKPGFEKSEVQLPETSEDLDEDGRAKTNPKQINRKNKPSQAEARDVVIGPDASAIKAAATAEDSRDLDALPTEMPKLDESEKPKGLTISTDIPEGIKIPPAATPPPMNQMPTLVPNVLPAGGSL